MTDHDAGVDAGSDPRRRDPAGGPPPAFLEELAAAFRRLSPQGTAGWNFSDAFGRLERVRDDLTADRAGPSPAGTATATSGEPGDATAGRVQRGGPGIGPGGAGPAGAGPDGDGGPERGARPRIPPHRNPRVLAEAWLDTRIRFLAEGAVRRLLPPELAHESVSATVEALRFLSARVQQLEDAAAARNRPVDGLAWLVDPPALDRWAGPAVAWFGPATGPVVVGECGAGELAVALAGAGLTVRGAEPRGAVAWRAAEAGVDVHVGEVLDLLRSVPAGSLGGLVLAGVVDRVPLDQQLQLLATGTERLAPAAPVLVVGTRPDAVADGWAAVARDLLPGRPLHPETWRLLLERAGYTDVDVVQNDDAPGTYGVRGRR
ncbi:MAG TPA: hypothetical protein VHB02_13075 [Acidimicrobiales bacterium]|nr:hypothetical protein [Acidimicrobiales bacterium]